MSGMGVSLVFYHLSSDNFHFSPRSNNLLAVGVVGGVVLWHINSAARQYSIHAI